MSAILPINLDSLLACRGVESERVEFKASWDAKTTGPQVLRTICAFANDYHNLNGGYVVIGVGERDGRAALPPAGLTPVEIESAQQWLRGQANRLDPIYQPILSPEVIDGRHVLVVWAPASDVRPHRVPEEGRRTGRFWIRLGSETVDAERRGDLLRGLIEQTARVPWDDRRAQDAQMADLIDVKVREHLHAADSALVEEPEVAYIYRRMRLTAKVNDHEVPRNVGLLFFAQDPSVWYRGAAMDVVQFAADRAGDVQEERSLRGPLADQLRDCLNYLGNLSTAHLQKQPDQPRVRRWVSFPPAAVKEIVVNAVYHRGYDVDQPEPTKVYLFPDRLEVTSYPGPVPGIEPHHLRADAPVPSVPARNRRIGELLKERGLAEARLSGLRRVFQAMAANGSPPPRFDFDQERTYFQATLPAHPEYVALSAMRDAAHLRALGEENEAFHRIESAWRTNPASQVLASEAVRMYAKGGATEFAQAKIQTAKETLADGRYDDSRCLLTQAGTLLALVRGDSSERYAWVRRELVAARRQVAESQPR